VTLTRTSCDLGSGIGISFRCNFLSSVRFIHATRLFTLSVVLQEFPTATITVAIKCLGKPSTNSKFQSPPDRTVRLGEEKNDEMVPWLLTKANDPLAARSGAKLEPSESAWRALFCGTCNDKAEVGYLNLLHSAPWRWYYQQQLTRLNYAP
jgi:hypothetical protein